MCVNIKKRTILKKTTQYFIYNVVVVFISFQVFSNTQSNLVILSFLTIFLFIGNLLMFGNVISRIYMDIFCSIIEGNDSVSFHQRLHYAPPFFLFFILNHPNIIYVLESPVWYQYQICCSLNTMFLKIKILKSLFRVQSVYSDDIYSLIIVSY